MFLRPFLKFICILSVFIPHVAFAQKSPSIIRDTEIEAIMSEWFTPVLEATGMSKNSVNVILVQSNQLNAFVAGGANVFFYTGLIDKTENPGELIGVFAHELGHISGGHLIAQKKAFERASYESILGTILGIGAAVASGNGAAAGAIIAGSGGIAQRRFLAHSRIHESSADQAALTVLEKAEMNPAGLVSFMEKLGADELLPANQQSEYVRTHPLTSNRIRALQTKANNSSFINKAWPDHWVEQHRRMKAKLIGFSDPGQVPWVYDDKDLSIPARYARAIAAYRLSNVKDAIRGINALIKMEPVNPYFYELKGQMLVDFGRIEEAIAPYQKAVELKGDAPLIRVALGHALLERDKEPATIRRAMPHLKRALQDEPRLSRAHRLMASAYSSLGQEDYARYHSAEEALLQRRFDFAKRQVTQALKTLPENSKEWIKGKDILKFIENQEAQEN